MQKKHWLSQMFFQETIDWYIKWAGKLAPFHSKSTMVVVMSTKDMIELL